MDDLDISADCLLGVKEIAAFLGVSWRRGIYLLETGRIPAGKQGGRWVASKAALREYYRRLTGAPAAPGSSRGLDELNPAIANKMSDR